jgi:pyruvate/2-oxoglutarate dehydrogenase complex dihydrolipoamide acyltransferase (E2) component
VQTARAEGQGAGRLRPVPAAALPRPAALAAGRLRQVRPGRAQGLSRIKKISGANLHRNWVMIPHVTNHDDADITDLEAFRVQTEQGEREERRQGHDAGLHDQGLRGGAEEVPRVQRLAGRRRSWC